MLIDEPAAERIDSVIVPMGERPSNIARPALADLRRKRASPPTWRSRAI
jgi:hypothetical protein